MLDVTIVFLPLSLDNVMFLGNVYELKYFGLKYLYTLNILNLNQLTAFLS